jgi:TatA/E family protein of Tat protein translocase
MIIIFLLALLIFGPKKLPELGKTVAKAMGEFRRASSELKQTWDREMDNIEKETAPIKQAAQEYHEQVYNSYDDPSHYDYGAYDSGTSQATATPSSTVGEPATQGAEQTAAIATTEPAALLPEAGHSGNGSAPAVRAPEGTVAQGESRPTDPEKPVAG